MTPQEEKNCIELQELEQKTLTLKDIETIERLIYKNNDDLAVLIARSFERLEDRIDAMECRIYARISEIEDRIEATRQAIRSY